ncbi:NAD-dependent epimerase/dehydratase family protein [Microbacterium sp. NPDC058342]|uniref:NAD-dependent epimerase/dehydratase family protein n=1 Tax=Microbacterium sp. NPDC058342 TaxID=3346454 RepID=UPI0036624F4C
MNIVITGAAGGIGRELLPRLAAAGHDVSGFDIEPDPGDAAGWTTAPLSDDEALREAFRGAELVVHLAGVPREDTWERILEANVTGTRDVLEAARETGVRRVLLAGSVHAAGWVRREDAESAVSTVRPDTYYGVGKAAAEALGSLYADRHGMTVVTARIMTFGVRPRTVRMLETWLSPGDLVRLTEAVATMREGGHHIVWGVSANTRRPVSLEPGRRIGYHPLDDAESFADAVESTQDAYERLGGPFTDPAHPVGVPWSS